MGPAQRGGAERRQRGGSGRRRGCAAVRGWARRAGGGGTAGGRGGAARGRGSPAGRGLVGPAGPVAGAARLRSARSSASPGPLSPPAGLGLGRGRSRGGGLRGYGSAGRPLPPRSPGSASAAYGAAGGSAVPGERGEPRAAPFPPPRFLRRPPPALRWAHGRQRRLPPLCPVALCGALACGQGAPVLWLGGTLLGARFGGMGSRELLFLPGSTDRAPRSAQRVVEEGL